MSNAHEMNASKLNALYKAAGRVVTEMINTMTPEQQQRLIALCVANPLELRLQMIPIVRLVVSLTSAPENDPKNVFELQMPDKAPIDPMKMN